MDELFDAVIVGAAIIDIPAGPVGAELFTTGRADVDSIAPHTGGDALNEALVLGRLGKRVYLAARTGDDPMADLIADECALCGVDATGIIRCGDYQTGVSLVLFDHAGERSFIINRAGSLRKLTAADVDFARIPRCRVFCFASFFIFPLITPEQIGEMLRQARSRGAITCADMTSRKNSETIDDLRPALAQLDYIFPNVEEASLITGLTDPDGIADAFLDAGVGCAVIKTGARGCLVKSRAFRAEVPAVPGVTCLDSTGAGDTFAAAFIAGLCEGLPPVECARLGCAAASITIEHIGAGEGVASRAQVSERLMRVPPCRGCAP